MNFESPAGPPRAAGRAGPSPERVFDVAGLAWLLGAFALGFAAGAAYFAALWATVRVLPATRRPALVLFGSFVLRFGVVAAVFVMMVRDGGFSWIAAALAGFFLARLVIVRRLLPAETAPGGDAT